MSDRNEDADIRKRLRTAHERWESRAPSFRELVERPRRSQNRYTKLRTMPVLLAAFAIATLVLVAGYVAWNLKPQSLPLDADISAISNWRSPTDFLLKTPGDELLKTTPAIPSGLPDFDKFQKLETLSGNTR